MYAEFNHTVSPQTRATDVSREMRTKKKLTQQSHAHDFIFPKISDRGDARRFSRRLPL